MMRVEITQDGDVCTIRIPRDGSCDVSVNEDETVVVIVDRRPRT